MLAISLALVIGVVIPIFKHGARTGDNAVVTGQTAKTRIVQVFK